MSGQYSVSSSTAELSKAARIVGVEHRASNLWTTMQINQSNLNPCWMDSSVDTGIGHTQTNEQNPHLSQSLKSHGWMRGSTFQKLLKFYIKGVSLKSLKQAFFGLQLVISWHRKKMFPEKQINHKLSSQPQLFTLTVLLSFL